MGPRRQMDDVFDARYRIGKNRHVAEISDPGNRMCAFGPRLVAHAGQDIEAPIAEKST